MGKDKKSDNLTELEREIIKLKSLFLQVFNNEAGYRVLHHIMNLCGYHETNIVNNAKTRELLLESMLFNEAKRDTWLRIRPLLSKDILKKVEIDMHDNKVIYNKPKKSNHPYLDMIYGNKEESSI